MIHKFCVDSLVLCNTHKFCVGIITSKNRCTVLYSSVLPYAHLITGKSTVMELKLK
jgi:hypothetical protein